jgi:hypothetical protein
MVHSFFDIPVKGRLSSTSCPSQYEPSLKRDAKWHLDCLSYFSSFYNAAPGAVYAGAPINRVDENVTDAESNPVQFMVKMMLYYLGKQPNMNYAFLTEDAQRKTMQSMWIRNQNTKEFVDYFRGIIRGKIANAQWSSRPMSGRAETEKTQALNKMMLSYDLKPLLKDLKEQFGIDYSPANGKDFQIPEQVQEWMETDWKEYGSELLTSLSNGIWFEGGWTQKVPQAFMHSIITSNCAMEHYMRGGRLQSDILMPYQIIKDNRIDNDYGMYDQFIGRIEVATPTEIKTLFPGLTDDQVRELEVLSNDNKARDTYNSLSPNFKWWSTNSGRNLITWVRMYWRTKNVTERKLSDVEGSGNRIIRSSPSDPGTYITDDISTCVVIGNKYVGDFGFAKNMVEDYTNVSRPVFPIIRFQPNTFLGQSVSEVARIHKIVDEIDYMDYKIREMIGKAKGRIYIMYGDKFSEDNTPKEFFQEIESMGVTVRTPSGEVGDPEGKGLDLIDWTLDPNIDKLWNLIKDKEDRMKRIMSASDVAMGQNQTYYGNNVMQSMISQNSIGTSYLIDGFMDWVVLNMRYAANMYKNVLYTTHKDSDIRMMVGDRGVVFMKLLDGLDWEQVWVQLNVNDVIDEKQKDRILSIAQAAAQNQGLDFKDYLIVEKAKSVSEVMNSMDYSLKKREMKAGQNSQAESNARMAEDKNRIMLQAMLEDFKQDNENYRAEIKLMVQSLTDAMNALKTVQPPQDLTERIAGSQQ